MKDDRFMVRSFGITGMIEKVFDPLLDILDLDHPNYRDLHDLFGKFATLLSRRLTNYKKVCNLLYYLFGSTGTHIQM